MLGVLSLSLIIFFFGREIILGVGASMIRADFESLINRSYTQECIDQFSYGQESWGQLRFVSSKEYNLEIICEDFVSTPIILQSKKLPPLLYKQTIGSGFITGEDRLPSFIELSILGRHLFIYTDEQKIHSNYLSKPDLDYNNGPISSCQAHNFQCCNVEVQSGLGEQLVEVNDCPKSCYQFCQLRPSVISFASRPGLDDETRMVEIESGEIITFSYVLGNGKSDVFIGQLNKEEQVSVLNKLQTILFKKSTIDENEELTLPLTTKLDFGDGETYESVGLQDSVDHAYQCQRGLCFFQVKISIVDAKGVKSAENELTKMVVKVSRY